MQSLMPRREVEEPRKSRMFPNRKLGAVGQVWWLTLVIPALWEAEVGGSQGQEFKTSLTNMVKPHFY